MKWSFGCVTTIAAVLILTAIGQHFSCRCHEALYTRLIKRSMSLFELRFSVIYIFAKYFNFSKTLHKIFHFQHILKLTTVTLRYSLVTRNNGTRYESGNHASRVSLLGLLVAGIRVLNSGREWECDRQALSNITRLSIWKDMVASAMLWLLLMWIFLS